MSRPVKKRQIEQALHLFNDPGEPISIADYRPITVQTDPERYLALIFAKLGQDYGGPLPADFVLHAVLQSGPD